MSTGADVGRSRVATLDFQISNFKIQISDFRSRISDLNFQVVDFRFRISHFRLRVIAPLSPRTLPAVSIPTRSNSISAGNHSHASRLEIDLDAAAENLRAIRGHVGAGVAVCGVLKKDGYGVGAVPLAHPLVRAGVDMLAVYGPEEAEELLAAAVTVPMLLLMPVRALDRTSGLYRHAAAGRLNFSVHDPEQLESLAASGRTLGLTLRLHLYVDTGMTRSGLSEGEVLPALERVRDDRHLQVTGIYSHLAAADSEAAYAREQASGFERVLRAIAAAGIDSHEAAGVKALAKRGAADEGITFHLANSYATLRSADYHHAMVRPGLALLGYGAEALIDGPASSDIPPLRPVVRWVSTINHAARYPAGRRVGYGGTYTLPRESVLGVVPVGYGDGYPMGLSGGGASVRVRLIEGGPWYVAAVLGRVNMDQLVVDLTDVKGATLDMLRGGEVEIYSDDPAAPNAVPRLAGLAGTHPYELLCRLSPRLARVYEQRRGGG